MNFYKLWAYPIYTCENVLLDTERQQVADYVLHRFKDLDDDKIVNVHVAVDGELDKIPSDLKLLYYALYVKFSQYVFECGNPLEEYFLHRIAMNKTRAFVPGRDEGVIYELHADDSVNDITCVYYAQIDTVHANGGSAGGDLRIYNRAVLDTTDDTREAYVTCKPVDNKAVMFPGSLIHEVRPYFGERPRVSLNYKFRRYRRNISLKPKLVI